MALATGHSFTPPRSHHHHPKPLTLGATGIPVRSPRADRYHGTVRASELLPHSRAADFTCMHTLQPSRHLGPDFHPKWHHLHDARGEDGRVMATRLTCRGNTKSFACTFKVVAPRETKNTCVQFVLKAWWSTDFIP